MQPEKAMAKTSASDDLSIFIRSLICGLLIQNKTLSLGQIHFIAEGPLVAVSGVVLSPLPTHCGPPLMAECCVNVRQFSTRSERWCV
jgi:hypothetical protein